MCIIYVLRYFKKQNKSTDITYFIIYMETLTVHLPFLFFFFQQSIVACKAI